ncbi:Glycosyl transferase, family 6 [Candidatus Nanopelagicaceae bacterium]
MLTIATNKYVHYWREMAYSLDRYLSMHNDVTFVVYTDQSQAIREMSSNLAFSKVEIIEIPSWKWPEVALKRYEVINSAISRIEQDYLVYIDADMVALSDIPKVTEILENASIALTRHPGFWRPDKPGKYFLYLRHPILATRDLRMWLKIGGLGAWESNNRSTSFIPRSERKLYFCGGFWLGKKTDIESLSNELMKQTDRDFQNGVEAKWLDESHLNRWAVSHKGEFKVLSPEYCFDGSYSQLARLRPKIEAVDKSSHPVENLNG